ncbi:hypothetical protein H0H93_004054 [Arthromyces matolae]|nr:hypothetical protein H0H93_004054 [Arthromyces matolae]
MPLLTFLYRRASGLSRPARNLSTAQIFGNSGSAEFIAAAGSVNSIPNLHGLPEVIVTGRANCGKSSLFNAVLGRRDLLHTSKKAGRTRELNFFRVGPAPGKLILVDAPGYGARGKAEWGVLFDKYLETRAQYVATDHLSMRHRLTCNSQFRFYRLRRVYILFNAKHPLNAYDTQMLEHLSTKLIDSRGKQPFTLQAVITKADCIPSDKVSQTISQLRKEIFSAAPLCLPPIVTSTTMSPPFGIEDIRKNIADACGL